MVDEMNSTISLYPYGQFDFILRLIGRFVKIESPVEVLAVGTVVGCDREFIYLKGGIKVSVTVYVSSYTRVTFLDEI